MKSSRWLQSIIVTGVVGTSVVFFNTPSVAASKPKVQITASSVSSLSTSAQAIRPLYSSYVSSIDISAVYPNNVFSMHGQVKYSVPFYQAGSYYVSFQMGALWADATYQTTPNNQTNYSGPIPLYASNDWNTGHGWSMAGWHGAITKWLWGNTSETAAELLNCWGTAGSRLEYGIGTYEVTGGKNAWIPGFTTIQ